MSTNSFDLMRGSESGSQVVPNPIKKTDEVLLSEKLFESYRSSRNTWDTEAIEDDDFRNGAQWTDLAKKELGLRGQFPIVVNVIHPAVETGKAFLTANRPRFNATAREDSDRHTAKAIAELMTWVWDQSDGNVELKQAIDDYYVKGLGYLEVGYNPYLDFGHGEITIKCRDPFTVYVDPNSKDIFFRDAAHIIISVLMTSEQLQSWRPGINTLLQSSGAVQELGSDKPTSTRTGLEGQGSSAEVQDAYHDKYRFLLRYSRIKKIHFSVWDSTAEKELVLDPEQFSAFMQQPVAVLGSEINGIKYITDWQEVQKYMEIANKIGLIFHFTQVPSQDPNQPAGEPQIAPGPELGDPNAVPGSEVQMQFTVMGVLVKRGLVIPRKIIRDRVKRVVSIGGVEVEVSELPIDNYPIIPLCNRHNRNPYPISDVRLARGLQEYVNKIRSLIVAHASSSTNVKLLIPRGAVDKKELKREWGKAGTGVIEYDPELGVPIIAGPVPLPNELYKNEAQARQDIEQIFGIFAFMQGESTSAPTTYKGTVAMDEFAQRRIQSKKHDVEAMLNQIALIVVQLMQVVYTDRKVIRILQPSGMIKEQEVNGYQHDDESKYLIGRINDITVGHYDLVVVSGSMLPSNRWALYEYYKEMYKEGLIDQIEVLEKSEVVDIEGVLQRFNIIKELQSQLAQAQQQIKMLSGDLQTAQRESVQDRKRVEVEKFKVKLSTAANKAEAAKMIYEARLGDTLKNLRATTPENPLEQGQEVPPQQEEENEPSINEEFAI